jgi:hypothetical protein
MAVASVGTPQNTHSATGSVTGTWGTGQARAAGNVLAAFVSAGASTSVTAIASSSTGWVPVATASNTATAQVEVAAWVKTATGADAAPVFTSTETGTAGGMDCVLFELSGANPLQFLDTAAVYASGASTGTLTMTATTGKVLSAGEYAISVFAQERAAASLTWTDSGSGGFSTLLNGNGASSVLQTYVGTKSAPASGATLNDAGAFSTNTTAFGAGLVVVFCLAPAAVTGVPPAPLEAFANNAAATVVTGGTTSPASGTSETWSSVNVTGAFPVASAAQQFHVIDQLLPSEKILVTVAPGGTGAGQSWTVTRGADGTTPVAHTAGFSVIQSVTAGAFNALRDRVQYFNVVSMFGADPSGAADSTQAQQNAINAANAYGKIYGGAVVYWPAGIYTISQTLVLPSTATNYAMCYEGDGEQFTIIQQAAGTTLNAVMASADWINEVSPAFGSMVQIRHMSFKGQPTQAAGLGHGLVLQTFWSDIEYCTFQNTLGDGLRFDSQSVRGNVTLASTLIENHVFRCQFRAYKGCGLNCSDTAGLLTDGWVEDCIFTTTAGTATFFPSLKIDSSAGWDIERNHFYGSAGSAIAAGHPWQTRIAGNYIENWGSSTTVGTYCAIDMVNGFVNDGGFGSVVTQNCAYLNTAPGAGGSFLGGIGVQAANGSQAHLTIADNVLFCGLVSGNANCFGIILWNQNSGSVSGMVLAGNNIIGGTNWAGGYYNISTNGGSMDLSTFVPAQVTVPGLTAGGSSVYCDAAGLPAAVGPSGLAGRFQRAVPASTSVVTTTAASIASLGSLSVNANDPAAGARYRVTGHGTLGTATVAPVGTLDLRWGGTAGTLLLSLVSNTSMPAFPVSLSAVPFEVEGEVWFVTASTCVGWLKFLWRNSTTATTAPVEALAAITSPVTVTVSSAQLLTLDWTWSAAAAGTTISAFTAFERVA